MTALPRPLSAFSQSRYVGYPHTNAFADGGASLVFGQIEESTVSLWKHCRATGEEKMLCRFPVTKEPPQKMIWLDIALEANLLMAIVDQSVWLLSLNEGEDGIGKLREIYCAPNDSRLNALPSITADGRQMLVGLHPLPGTDSAPGGRTMHSALHIDVETGRRQILFEHEWFANHFHFSPRDPQWIGYCHEGPTTQIPDRVWAWHGAADEAGMPVTSATAGRCLYDQAKHCPPFNFCLGHERWSFHDVSVVVPAYGESTSGPTGLYELFPDDRPARLVSEGNRDWHCDVSRDGRWAVVDTTGSHDAPDCGWENAGDTSDILLINMQTGARTFLARSRQHRHHPRHPHPVFSPDGTTIYYNEPEPNGPGNRIMAVDISAYNLL